MSFKQNRLRMSPNVAKMWILHARNIKMQQVSSIYLFIIKLVPRYTKKKKRKNTRKTQTIEKIQKQIQKTWYGVNCIMVYSIQCLSVLERCPWSAEMWRVTSYCRSKHYASCSEWCSLLTFSSQCGGVTIPTPITLSVRREIHTAHGTMSLYFLVCWISDLCQLVI